VGSWNLPTVSTLIAYDLLVDIRSDPDWSNFFDPVHKHQLILEGHLGALYGSALVVDGFKYENLRVLNTGEVYQLTAPQALGGYTQRDTLQSKAIDKYAWGQAKRGWFVYELLAIALTNPRGVAKATRL
jgi:hypothetical protein